jgi:hypothetical protein
MGWEEAGKLEGEGNLGRDNPTCGRKMTKVSWRRRRHKAVGPGEPGWWRG